MRDGKVLLVAGGFLGVLLLPHIAGAQQIVIDANTVTVREGNSPLLQYRYGGVPFKPYVKELYTPGGSNVFALSATYALLPCLMKLGALAWFWRLRRTAHSGVVPC